MKTENKNSLNTLKIKAFTVFVFQESFHAALSKKENL